MIGLESERLRDLADELGSIVFWPLRDDGERYAERLTEAALGRVSRQSRER